MRVKIAFLTVLCILLRPGTTQLSSFRDEHKEQHSADLSPDQFALDLEHLPQNIALYAGQTVTLTCWVDTFTVAGRVQWMEFASNPGGALISDNDFILPAHNNSDRYTIITSGSNRQYDLQIRDVRVSDGGVYLCTDTTAPIATKQRAAAQLIVIETRQACETTIPLSGLVVEGLPYTIECTIFYSGNIAPHMIWTGPGAFDQNTFTGDTFVFNFMRLTANRVMQGQNWESLVNFTGSFLPVPNDMADNIPDFEERFNSISVSVQWPPQNMSSSPVSPLDEYEVGDTIECFADSFPPPSYEWQNVRTNERFQTQSFTIPGAWLGTNQLMRCTATNVVNGVTFSGEYVITVNVPLTTPEPPTTTPTTTTPPPVVSKCGDISGYWVSNNPSLAHLCIDVDLPSIGNVHGVLRTGYEVFWFDLIGQTNMPDFDHTSWTAIWPLNRAVTTFIGECSRCFGEEILLVNAVSRSKGTGTCGIPGVITYTEQYEFRRSPGIQCPPITIPT